MFPTGSRLPAVVLVVCLASIMARAARAEDTAAATIRVTASPAGSNVGARLVEGVMEFRGHRYLLTLRGVSGPVSSVGSVVGLVRPRDVEGPYTSTPEGLRNESGVTIHFVPPLEIPEGPLEIAVTSRIYPKASTGQGSDAE